MMMMISRSQMEMKLSSAIADVLFSSTFSIKNSSLGERSTIAPTGVESKTLMFTSAENAPGHSLS